MLGRGHEYPCRTLTVLAPYQLYPPTPPYYSALLGIIAAVATGTIAHDASSSAFD